MASTASIRSCILNCSLTHMHLGRRWAAMSAVYTQRCSLAYVIFSDEVCRNKSNDTMMLTQTGSVHMSRVCLT